MKKIQKKRKGFTLIELVVVIVIIAILAAVALLRFGGFTETAKDSRIKQEHAQLITAGNMWRAAQDDPEKEYPTSLSDVMFYFESTKPLSGQTVDAAGEITGNSVHSISGEGELRSKLTKAGAADLVYDFKATAP